MTLITTILREAHRLLGILALRSIKALNARMAAIRWRRKTLRSLRQRRRE